MTERIHYDSARIKPPFLLNPVTIANLLSGGRQISQGTFVTNLVIRYHPDVSTTTPGTVAFGLSTSILTTPQEIAATSPSYAGAIWQPAILNVPKSTVNTQTWMSANSPALYLVASAVTGSFSLTCTIKLVSTLLAPVSLSPREELERLSLLTYVGPQLEGFSLVCCIPQYIDQWQGNGLVLNVDLTRAKGNTTTSNYGLATPNNKDYVAVVFGCSPYATWNYNSQNSSASWKDYTRCIWQYNYRDLPSGAPPATYYGSWRPIKGSTSWWCDIRPATAGATINGSIFRTYQAIAIVVLYYYYPNTDVFASDFLPGIQANPGLIMPEPPGQAQPEQPTYVPLLMATTQLLWSPYWEPTLTEDQLVRFSTAKQYLQDWPATGPGPRKA